MREVFDVIGKHWLLTLFLGFVGLMALEAIGSTIVNVVKVLKNKKR